jgi:hypothetical protein
MFGTLELSSAWVADNRVESSVTQAARLGAASGANTSADRDLLVALRASLAPQQLANLDRVVVFRAPNPTAVPPAGCVKALGDLSEVGATDCNTYSGATVRSVTVASMTGFGGTVGTKDRYWAPTTRNDSLVDPPDYLGVWIRTLYHGVTGFDFATITITAKAVYRVQPDLGG